MSAGPVFTEPASDLSNHTELSAPRVLKASFNSLAQQLQPPAYGSDELPLCNRASQIKHGVMIVGYIYRISRPPSSV